jgi:cytochrome c-type biogenesis protein CcmH/NrfF
MNAGALCVFALLLYAPLVLAGRSDEQIRDQMVARYGAFCFGPA